MTCLYVCQPKIVERDGILRENRQASAKSKDRDLDVSATVFNLNSRNTFYVIPSLTLPMSVT